MIKRPAHLKLQFVVALVFLAVISAHAQTETQQATANSEVKEGASQPAENAGQEAVPVKQEAEQPAATQAQEPGQGTGGIGEVVAINTPSNPEEALAVSQNVTLDFKEADIRNVLKIISLKSGVNIVATPDVMGAVTIRLVDVPWQRALDILLKTYAFGYERQGNVILVTKAENMSKIQSEEPLQTEIFNLKFLDAQDAQRVLIPLLSPRGKISILYSKGQKGWNFGTFQIGKGTTSGTEPAREKGGMQEETVAVENVKSGGTTSVRATTIRTEPSIKSKTVIVIDTAAALDRIRNFMKEIDKKPRQVLIEARLMEVNKNKLKDLGVDWGVGATGNAETNAVTTQSVVKNGAGISKANMGGHSIASEFTPALFGPLESLTNVPGVEPYNFGAQLVLQKLTGTRFEAILHALEEDAHTNTLSAPRILTLDNQEASILVGYHTPILASTVTASTSSGAGATVTQTLDYYQEIGIRLNVVPQISEEGFINMIIHPSVTSSSSSVPATSTAGNVTTTTNYPVIDVREAQTQVLLRDGETIVLGGLLKDVKSKETLGIPILSKIPFIGGLFRRDVYDTQKVDLLMFITARVVKDELTPLEIAKLQEQIGKEKVEKKEDEIKRRKALK